jgi:arsenical pump membrane protein
VLLTPLYIRIAQRNGINPLVLAVQPLILASLASSALPVSNLTNLIAVEQLDVGVVDTLRWLGLPSLVACVIGFVSYRRWSAGAMTSVPIDEPVDARALRRGLPVVAVMVLGFTWVIVSASSRFLFQRRRWCGCC